jgi:hypothetical protein
MSRPPEVSWRELRGVRLDPSLSLAAKGLLEQMLMRPPGTVLTRAELFETNRDAMVAIDAAIEELARAGLVVKVPPRKRSQGRRSGGVRLPVPAVHRPQPEPDLDAAPVIGARPAPAWWDVWQVPVTAVSVRRPLKGRAVEREGRG